MQLQHTFTAPRLGACGPHASAPVSTRGLLGSRLLVPRRDGVLDSSERPLRSLRAAAAPFVAHDHARLRGLRARRGRELAVRRAPVRLVRTTRGADPGRRPRRGRGARFHLVEVAPRPDCRAHPQLRGTRRQRGRRHRVHHRSRLWHRRRADAPGGTVATTANVGGLALGPLVSGLLARYVPDGLTLPYLVTLAALVIALFALAIAPEGHAPVQPRPRYRPQRLSAPESARGVFFAAVAAVFVTFSADGLLAGLSGTFLAGPLHHPSPALTGLAIFLTFGSGVVVQTTTTSWSIRRLRRPPRS